MFQEVTISLSYFLCVFLLLFFIFTFIFAYNTALFLGDGKTTHHTTAVFLHWPSVPFELHHSLKAIFQSRSVISCSRPLPYMTCRTPVIMYEGLWADNPLRSARNHVALCSLVLSVLSIQRVSHPMGVLSIPLTPLCCHKLQKQRDIAAYLADLKDKTNAL